VRTVNLWWSEGVTDYYADVILARAGLDRPADFAQRLVTSIGNHRSNPARLLISPERSSWTVWDSPAVNNNQVISYYLQGELLGFLLDLAIRDSTDNAKSLDDVMRYLLDHYAGERGFTRDELVAAVRSATGRNFEEFWRLYVSGAREIPWDDYLRAAGWKVVFTETPAIDARIGSIPPAVQGGRWRAVAAPGSAAEAAGGGLRTGDELVRINGRPIIDGTDVTAAVRAIGRGAVVVVEVVRDGQPLTIRFSAGTYNRVRAQLREVPAQTGKMRRIRAGLVGAAR
jgi:predicted metalloprotease with PDZ domain